MKVGSRSAACWLVLLALAGCGQERIPGDLGGLKVDILTPVSVLDNPYQNIFKLTFELHRQGNQVYQTEVRISDDSIADVPVQLDPLEFELDRDQWTNLTLTVSGIELGAGSQEQVVSRGRSLLFDLKEDVSISVYLSPVGAFSSPGETGRPRFGHTATLLPDDRVLVFGGASDGTPELPSSLAADFELYEPSSASFAAASGIAARLYHSATLLADGRVLIYGGLLDTDLAAADAHIFDPTDNSLVELTLSPVPAGRLGHTATLLRNGTILVAGGSTSFPGFTAPAESAFLLDPDNGHTNIETAATGRPRAFHRAVATETEPGEVLLLGGVDGDSSMDSVEVFTQADNTIADLSEPGGGLRKQLLAPRTGHSAIRIIDGNIFILGGNVDLFAGPADSLSHAEVLDAGQLGLLDIAHDLPFAAREWHSATLLENGQVLIAGGWQREQGSVNFPASAELFTANDIAGDDYNGTLSDTVEGLFTPRALHSATLLADGTVLIIGGLDDSGVLSQAEIYNPPAEP